MTVLVRLAGALLFFCFCSGAMAQADKLKVGVGLICDGSNQVERYLKLSRGEGSPVEALKVVNDEANKTACGVASIAFVVGEEVGTVKLKDGVMHIMQIMVVATQTQRGWQQVPPTVQYTAVFEKFEEV